MTSIQDEGFTPPDFMEKVQLLLCSYSSEPQHLHQIIFLSRTPHWARPTPIPTIFNRCPSSPSMTPNTLPPNYTERTLWTRRREFQPRNLRSSTTQYWRMFTLKYSHLKSGKDLRNAWITHSNMTSSSKISAYSKKSKKFKRAKKILFCLN